MGTKKERVYIRVTKAQKEGLQEMAQKENRSLSNYILTVVENHINKTEGLNMKKYLLITNGYNAVIWSDGEKYFVFDDKDGRYEGIDLYQDTKQVISQLRELEFDNGTFKDLCQTFPDNVHEVDGDFYNNTLIEF